MRRLLPILLSAMICLAAPVSWAQDSLSDEQQQRLVKLIEEGKGAYDAGQFQQSLEKFRQAYDIYGHPDIIYRIALCYERLGEDQEAVKYYRQFLREAPDAPERARIEKTIEVIEARISKSEIRITTQPEGAVVYIDDVANGAAGYTPTALAVKPGNYQLIVQKEGFEPVRELVTVAAGQQVKVRYQLSPAVGDDNADATTKKKNSGGGHAPSVMFLTLASIGVASGITAAVFFNLHSNKRDELTRLDGLPRQDVPRTTYQRVENQARTNLIVAISATTVSAATLIWAYGVWVSDRNKNQTAALPSVGWTEEGPTVGVQWRF